jgi:N-acylneuraminate cytidylyltransferase
MYAVEQAQAVGIEKIVISTDIPSLIGKNLGNDVCIAERPAALSGDKTPMAKVLQHVLAQNICGGATIVLLQATTPLRAPFDVRSAIELHETGRFDLVLTVTRADSGVLKYGKADGDRFMPLSKPEDCFTNRASLPPVYRPDGAVYVFDADWFRDTGTLASKNIGLVETPAERALDIDTLADFETAQSILANYQRQSIR